MPGGTRSAKAQRIGKTLSRVGQCGEVSSPLPSLDCRRQYAAGWLQIRMTHVLPPGQQLLSIPCNYEGLEPNFGCGLTSA